ncbi:MAG: peptidoglycan-binding domain-containing protein [Pseudomonadota bacterium]
MVKGKDFLAAIGAERSDSGTARQPNLAYGAVGGGFKGAALSFWQTSKREVIASCVVVGLLSAVSVNALYLQTGKHPAPLFASQTTAKAEPEVSPAVTAAIPRPKTREIILERKADATVDPLVKAIQEELANRGYYNADLDGVMGARTRVAVGLYQRAFGQTVTNEASSALLEHIRLSPEDLGYHAAVRARLAKATAAQQQRVAHLQPASKPQKPKARVGSDVISDVNGIKKVQKALSNLGFGTLVVDGVVGSKTREAVRAFAEKRGLQPTGTITTAVLDELVKLNQL